MTPGNPLLFVYGTLRRDCPSGAHQTYLKDARFLGYARLQAHLFRVSYYPAIRLTTDNHWVIGEVYALHDQLQLDTLDSYEECPQPWHPEQEYRRAQVIVQMQTQSNRLAVWTYLYNRPTDNLIPIVSGDFLSE